MCERSMKRKSGTQRGYAMIGIIAAVGIAATTVLVTSLSSTAIQNEQTRKTNASLALAKQGLIGRAAVGGPGGDHPGSLPCPDTNNDGNAEGTCANVGQQIGRLPWKTLGLPDLRDADGERLWYAVSPNFRDIVSNIINSNTSGQLNVTGTIGAENVAAIVFAPGAQINAERRDGVERQNTVTNYLESIPYPGYTYYAAPPGDDYNDRMMVITSADIFSVVQKRVANEVQIALNAYFATNGMFPFAASAINSDCMASGHATGCASVQNLTAGLIPGKPNSVAGFPDYSGTATLLGGESSDWFETNKWRSVVSYQVSPACTTPTCTLGSLSVTVGTTTLTNQKVAISFSGVLNGTPEEVLKTAYVKSVQ